MINPRTLKPGALFWIRADITGNGEVWQRAMLRESDEGPMIRYLDSDSGEFEDYWDATDEDPANFRMDAPEAPNTPDVRVLREEIARLKNQIRAMKQAGMNTNAAFCEWAPPEVRAPYFAAWDAAVEGSALANVLDEPHGCLARSLRSRIRDKHPCWL